MRLDQEDYEAAAREAERVLADNASSLPALSALAAARYLQGDAARLRGGAQRAPSPSTRATPSSTTGSPRSARATASTARRRPSRQQAVALDPRSWRGHGILGLNQLRLGAIDDGRKSLEAAFAGDPYNVWIKNTLDLLDTFPQYRRDADARTSRILAPRARRRRCSPPTPARWPRRPTSALAARYGYRPDDAGAPRGLSRATPTSRCAPWAWPAWPALGVCFGPVLAIDSPSAREVGQFNWGSTLWHELAHTFTLGTTGNRVPRWLTRGPLRATRSAARGRAGATTSAVEFLRALKTGRAAAAERPQQRLRAPEGPGAGGDLVLPGVAGRGADRGPARLPRHPRPARGLSRRPHHRAGFQKVARHVPRGLRQGLLRRTSSSASRDPGRAATGPKIAGAAAERARHRRRPPRARRRRARRLRGPDGGGPGPVRRQQARGGGALPRARARRSSRSTPGEDSPHFYLAAIYKDAGQADAGGRRSSSSSPRSRTATTAPSSSWRACSRSRATSRGAAASLERALYISPFEAAVHERLAALYARARRPRRRSCAPAARWSRSTPSTRPEALYQLALALHEAGDAAGGAARGAARARDRAALPARPGAAARACHDAAAPGSAVRDEASPRGRSCCVARRGHASSPPATATSRRPSTTRTRPTTAASPSCASASSPRTGVPAGTCGAST